MSRVSLAHDAERSRHKGTVDSGVHAWSARCVVRLAWLCSSASSSSVYPSGSISSPTAVCSAIFRSQLIRASSLFICLNCAAVSVWVPALHQVVLHRQQPTTAFGRTRHRHRSTRWHSCSRRSPRHSSAGGEIGSAGASACSGGGTAGRGLLGAQSGAAAAGVATEPGVGSERVHVGALPAQRARSRPGC